ncbi:MAG: bifunctional pyr operon transcriptional regulator/uracil phosphoribosyltransferase PyrR [Actinomycetaceae bacterium]|nr:bifunctional pyr operon transcriptional regulator/uracil phosphoribosyltransferase PyrR [Actinomycetaceae bacterium]
MSNPRRRKIVLNDDDIDRASARIAYEIIEREKGIEDLVLLGIPTRGVTLADRLTQKIAQITGEQLESGSLDTTMYRDDLADQPMRAPHPTNIPPGGIDGRTVVLVDDVLYTGRTIKAALDALFDIGRPSRVRLAVLVDRGHRELPIRPDFVGKNLPTSRSETVTINFVENDGDDEVIIVEEA